MNVALVESGELSTESQARSVRDDRFTVLLGSRAQRQEEEGKWKGRKIHLFKLL